MSPRWFFALFLISGLVGCALSSRTPTPFPIPTPTPVILPGTPTPTQDISGIGSTDGIVFLAAVLTSLILLTALVRHQVWVEKKEEDSQENLSP
ncbi:MAG: hypothetical protein ACK4VW_07850 [Anaerolineales bacterium]